MAHELFHSIQWSTAFYKSELGCNSNNWLSEGQADAVGWDIVRKLRPDVMRNLSQDHLDNFVGQRRYSDPLAIIASGASQSDYHTSSFWRYLSELAAYRSSIARTAPLPPPGPDIYPVVDYSYLADFLTHTISSNTGIGGELAWLDLVIQSYSGFKMRLRDLYPDFIAAYAAYGEGRVLQYRGGGPAGRQTSGDIWRISSFDFWMPATGSDVSGCANAVLTPKNRVFRTWTKLYRVSGRCFAITLDGFPGEVSVEVQLHTNSDNQFRVTTQPATDTSVQALKL